MPNFKRSSLGMIIEDFVYLTASERGYEVFGKTKDGGKMVISFRKKDLDGAIADAARVAQLIANMRKREVRLDFLSERTELFYPEDANLISTCEGNKDLGHVPLEFKKKH